MALDPVTNWPFNLLPEDVDDSPKLPVNASYICQQEGCICKEHCILSCYAMED